ncbi:hypothetical protein AtEden1_Chr1g0033661 [Arabidopsis thaliana]
MKDHERAILEERINYYLAKRTERIVFAELDTGGKIIECPNCHVQFTPTLGNWIADKFACKSCKANLSFRNSTAKTARCPCCTISRPVPNNFTMLVCGGCQVSVVHQKRDKTVKCSECKHINIPTFGRTYGVRPENQARPPQVYRIVPPQGNGVAPPQDNQDGPRGYQVVPNRQVNKDLPQTYHLVPCRNGVPQVNQDPSTFYQVVPRQVNEVPPQVNRVVPRPANEVPPQVNRIVPPRVYQRGNRAATAETESTASSSFNQKPEIIVVEYPDDSVAETVRMVATKRVVEVEQDKTEEAGNKKIRL